MIPISNEPLKTLQFHFYSPYKNFLTELVDQSLHFIEFPEAVIISRIEHVHPINNLNNIQLPYIIINNKQIISEQRIIKMLLMFIVQAQQQRNFQESRPSMLTWLLDIIPVFRITMQLNLVAQIFSQQQLNGYYTLISPLKKYSYNQFQKEKKRTLQNQTLFIKPSGQLDKEYFLLKLDQLHKIIKQYDQNKPHPIIYHWICLHLQILLRKLKYLNNILFTAVSADEIFDGQIMKKRQEERAKIKQLMKQRKPMNFFITNVNLKDQAYQNIKKMQEKQRREADQRDMQQGKFKTITKVVVGNIIFWGFYFML